MQAIIMAAGRGSRLGDLTEGIPKSFIEIKKKKLIDINIHMLRKHGIKNIIIVTGYHGEQFESKYGKEEGIILVYNPFYILTNVIGSFYMGMEHLKEDFIYMHADTICEPSILEELIEAKGDIILPVDTKLCDEEAMKVSSEEGKIRRISKKLDPGQCDGEFIGIAKIGAGVIDKLKEKTKQLLKEESFGEYFEAALERTLEDGNFETEKIITGNRFWAEIDYEEDYVRAEERIVPELIDF